MTSKTKAQLEAENAELRALLRKLLDSYRSEFTPLGFDLKRARELAGQLPAEAAPILQPCGELRRRFECPLRDENLPGCVGCKP